MACVSLVPVTSRIPVDELWSEPSARRAEWPDCRIALIQRIGDCLAPGGDVNGYVSGREGLGFPAFCFRG